MADPAKFPFVEFALTIGTWDLIDFAYVDTGFESGLLIPEAVGNEIVAAPDWSYLRLPNEGLVLVKTWTGILSLADRTFRVDVAALGNRYLLGRDILDQLEVCFEFGEQLRIRFRDEV